MTNTGKILVVDDEKGIRELLFDVLSREGFKVTLAKDGQDSLKQMRRRKFDLLITDVNMPKVDGIELLRKMKKAGRREKVIIMSGRPITRDDFGKGVLPIHTLLEKPFHIQNFLDVVTSVLEKSKKRKKIKAVKGKKKDGKCYLN